MSTSSSLFFDYIFGKLLVLPSCTLGLSAALEHHIESPKKVSRIYRNPLNSAFLSKSLIINIYFIKYLEPMETNTTLIIFAVIAALGLVTVVAIDVILTAQEAEAACRAGGTGFNASQGRCFKG
jgi:hypothetical protein